MKQKETTSPPPGTCQDADETGVQITSSEEKATSANTGQTPVSPLSVETLDIHLIESPFDIWCIRIGNVCVTFAAVLFLVSLLPEESVSAKYVLRGIGYFFGAVAYGTEVFALTDGFKEKLKFGAMYMPYVFGILYILLGISYLRH